LRNDKEAGKVQILHLLIRESTVIECVRGDLPERVQAKRRRGYLRIILIHGARAVVLRSKRERVAMGAHTSLAISFLMHLNQEELGTMSGLSRETVGRALTRHVYQSSLFPCFA
jgi:hypothetical protein